MIWARKKHEFRKMIDEDWKEAPVRFVTIPRHKGDNISLIKLLKKAGFDSPNENWIVWPQIEDFSSTEVRKALNVVTPDHPVPWNTFLRQTNFLI